MSTLAVFLALAGGATAIAITLGKNSVKSRHIARGAVKTSDLGRNAATGRKVRERSLAQVPRASRARLADNAGLLDGIDSSAFPRTRSVSDSNFGESDKLELTVEGFGTYSIECDQNGLGLTDDQPIFSQDSTLPGTALQTGFLATAADDDGEPATNFQVRGQTPAPNSFSIFKDDRLHVILSESVPGTERAIILTLGGYDNEATFGCKGHIQALVFG